MGKARVGVFKRTGCFITGHQCVLSFSCGVSFLRGSVRTVAVHWPAAMCLGRKEFLMLGGADVARFMPRCPRSDFPYHHLSPSPYYS